MTKLEVAHSEDVEADKTWGILLRVRLQLWKLP